MPTQANFIRVQQALAVLLALLAAIATIAVLVTLFLLIVALVGYERHGGLDITDGVWVALFGLVAGPFGVGYAINLGLKTYNRLTK
jgi:hypothetical protein